MDWLSPNFPKELFMALRRLQDMGMEKSFTYFELGSDGMILMYIYKNRMVCIASSSAIKSGCRPVKHILLPLDVQNSELGRIDIVNYVQVRCLFEFSGALTPVFRYRSLA